MLTESERLDLIIEGVLERLIEQGISDNWCFPLHIKNNKGMMRVIPDLLNKGKIDFVIASYREGVRPCC